MKNNFVKFSWILLIGAVVIALFHFLIYRALPAEFQKESIFFGEAFIFFITWLSLMLVAFSLKKMPKNVGFVFIGLSMVKMIITTVYLLPEILNKTASTKSFIFQFFGIYFAYLGIEAVLAFRELNKNV